MRHWTHSKLRRDERQTLGKLAKHRHAPRLHPDWEYEA
jgi:hypothetical protein